MAITLSGKKWILLTGKKKWALLPREKSGYYSLGKNKLLLPREKYTFPLQVPRN